MKKATKKPKTPEQLALAEERKLIKKGYTPSHPVSNSYGNETTAEYVAKQFKDAVIVFHPKHKFWGKIWKVWVKV